MYSLVKRYTNHFGLDLKSSDLNREMQFSSRMKNAQYRKSGSIEKRKGYQAHAASQGGHGLFLYNRVNPTTNLEEPIPVSVSNNAHKLNTVTLTVTYSGVNATCLFSMFYDTATSQYRAQILEGATLVLDMALGMGFDEASPITINALDTAISAIVNFTATVSGDGTAPAAFLEVTRDHDLSSTGGPIALDAKYWGTINSTVSNPLAGSETNKNTIGFENASATQLNNVLYIANGYDFVQKYDGQTLYRAGLPTPASISVALVAAGAVTGTNYLHVIQYIQKDAVGNFVEGNFLLSTTLLNPVGESFDVTIPNVIAGTGFNTNGAIVNGAQVAVNTITVDIGHTMKVGDTAYFYDSVSSAYVEREVTAIAATTITVAGAAVTVADNAVISNNLRIAVYRSKTAGATPAQFFLVAEIPNNSFAATQVYNDNLTDAQLGAEFIEPLTDRSAPPKGKYISSFRNQLVLTGNIENPTTVYYSDIENPEYFPADSNSFLTESIAGDINTGIAPNNEVFLVFKSQSIFVVSGDVASGNIRVSQLTSDIGCVAHATIKELNGSVAFLSDRGPMVTTGGQIPIALGDNRLEPVFDKRDMSQELREALFGVQIFQEQNDLKLKRAVAVNHASEEKYLLYIPTESTTSGNRHTNNTQKVFAYDYTRNAWLHWDNLDFSGGIIEVGDELYFSERRYSAFNTSVDHILYRRLNLGDGFDYQDNASAIEFDYYSAWEALNEPSVFKKYLKIRIFSIEDIPNNEATLSIQTEVNYTRDAPQSDFSISVGGSGYGQTQYGVAPYGDPGEFAVDKNLARRKLRSLRVKFFNDNPQENIIITGWELEMATPFKPAFKK